MGATEDTPPSIEWRSVFSVEVAPANGARRLRRLSVAHSL